MGGFVLLAAAFWAALTSAYGSGPRTLGEVSTGLALASLACHVAAVGTSLAVWRRRGGVPGVALFYGALAIAGGAWWMSDRAAEAAFFRDNPDTHATEFAGDGIDIRDGRGVWHVSFAGCPGARGASGTRSQAGIVEVMGDADRPAMRLHVAERRAECLGR